MGRGNFNFDWLIFVPALLLLCLGLVTLLSLDRAFFSQQVIYAFVGLGLFIVFSRIDFTIYRYVDRWIYAGCIIFLLLTFLGPNVRGSTRWLQIGGAQVQPSELVKPFLLLSWASFFIKNHPTKLRSVGIHLGLFLLPLILVFRQPDLGNAIVYAMVWLTVIIMAGVPLRYLFSGGVLAGVMLPLGYRVLHNYQRLRLLTFLDPFLDPKGAGYNAIQSMIAVGSGMFFGRGFGRGTQTILKFLPEHHTDFIFAALGEEFGFVGAGAVLGLFFILLWRILTHLQQAMANQLAYLYLAGFFMQIFVHVVINIGMNVGVLPITGITLPFVSYGGSSLLSLWMGLGIAVAIQRRTHQL